MQNKKIDLIVFDSDDSLKQSCRSSRIFGNTGRKESQQGSNYEIIEQEMQYLSEKIHELEQAHLSIAQNDSYSPLAKDSNHTHEVVMTIEKKLQIIVRETRRMMKAIAESISTQISNKIDQKYSEKGLHQMQRQYESSLKVAEEHYRKEADRLSRHYSQVENKMVVKVIEVEQKLLAKIAEFERKEKEYVEWIHHLEKQLKEREAKIKKVIEATLDQPTKKYPEKKKESEEVDRKIVVMRERENLVETPQKRLVTSINENSNNSRISRKHKIFDNYNKELSLSRDRDLKLRNSQTNFYSQSFVSLKPTKVVNPATRIVRANDSQTSQPVTLSFKGSEVAKPTPE